MSATEPSADIRQLASVMWQTFVALQSQGFSEQQSLMIIGQILAANAKGGDES